MKVLVGIDLNVSGHDWLLERATHLAGSLGGTVDLVFIAQQKTSEHQAKLQGMLSLLIPEPLQGVARIETGDPADVLIELSNTYDVMVIGPREPAAIQRFLLGPMAVRILRKSVCPILVPRAERPLPEQPRMLVGLDIQGPAIDQILTFATAWAGKLGGVLDGVFAVPGNLPPIRNKEVREVALREFLATQEPERRALAEVLKRIPEGHRGAAHIEVGEPEDVLVKMSSSYDLVLVGNRGRTGLTRLLMGNVANHVVRTAGCDVLVLPTAALVPE
ncbi:MAG: universal stress protein [Alphaproteobacteria bacterium]|nr:universal stress protein [Alphaproteobacteria bacterium]MCB9694002.1 universal stress protein [Alphaproteobacteria bacterium]